MKFRASWLLFIRNLLNKRILVDRIFLHSSPQDRTPHRVQYISDKILGKCSEPVEMTWRARRTIAATTALKQNVIILIIAAYMTSLQPLYMAGAVPWAQLHERDAGGGVHLRHGEEDHVGGEGAGGLGQGCPGGRHQEGDAACLSQGTERNAASLNLRVMGEQSVMLKACLSKAMGEQIYRVEDYMGVERGEKRHGSLYTPEYNMESSREKLQPTHHLGDQGGDLCHGAGDQQHQGGGFGRARVEACCLSSCPEKQVHHRKSSMFDEGYKGNVIELTTSEGKYYAMEEVQRLFDNVYKGNVTKLFVMYGVGLEFVAVELAEVKDMLSAAPLSLTKGSVMTHSGNYGNTGTERTSVKAKDSAVDVVEKGVVEKGQEEQVKKEKILQMLRDSHLSTCPPRVYWMTQSWPEIKSSPKFVIICKPVLYSFVICAAIFLFLI